MASRGSQSPQAVDRAPAEIWRLLPREHGAYAQFIFPLLTALALGNWSASQFLWAAAAIALFVAHEPLLILAGERGRRSHAQLGERARIFAVLLLIAAMATGALGWWQAPQPARRGLLVPLALGALLVPLIISHREKSLAGELLAALIFATMLIPVARAGAVSLRAALIATAVWSVIFALGIFMVRAVIAKAKRATVASGPVYASCLLNVAAMALSLVLLLTGAVPRLAAAAILPAALITLVCNFTAIHPRHLRGLGWSLVGSNVIALAAVIMALR